MASGGKRSGGGERVLESRHVIGLFLLMLLFSGVFFALGYRMGIDQYNGQVRAAGDVKPRAGNLSASRSEPAPSKSVSPEAQPPISDLPSSEPRWGFHDAGDPKKSIEPLKPETPAPKAVKATQPAPAKNLPQPKSSAARPKSSNPPLIRPGEYSLQVAALTKESDAVDLAAQLTKKKFQAYVLPARTDKYYRVQVGPFPDRKAADSARKGLEGAGFKAILKH
jgi:cell division septation protein DedD